jgi:hypothetical protein
MRAWFPARGANNADYAHSTARTEATREYARDGQRRSTLSAGPLVELSYRVLADNVVESSYQTECVVAMESVMEAN